MGVLKAKIRKTLEARGKGTLKMLKSLATLSPVVTWKIGSISNILDELAKDISRQSAKGAL